MKMIRRAITLSVFASFALAAGAPSGFEVASIRPSQGGRESVEVVPGSVTMRNMRLLGAMRWAYNVLDVQVSGPDWINEARFDIAAKTSVPATESEMQKMMQALLADRFKLALHRETKELTALVLTVAKAGHKLKAVETEGSPSLSIGPLNLTGKGATIAQLITFLSAQISLPIVDQTELTGRYDYFMDINAYVTDDMRRQNGPPLEAPSIIASALQAQLGLKADTKKMPLDVLVVDKMEREPTEN